MYVGNSAQKLPLARNNRNFAQTYGRWLSVVVIRFMDLWLTFDKIHLSLVSTVSTIVVSTYIVSSFQCYVNV